MPTSIAPMLAQLANTLPTDDLSYGYEFKWDGSARWRDIYVDGELQPTPSTQWS